MVPEMEKNILNELRVLHPGMPTPRAFKNVDTRPERGGGVRYTLAAAPSANQAWEVDFYYEGTEKGLDLFPSKTTVFPPASGKYGKKSTDYKVVKKISFYLKKTRRQG